MGLKCSQYNTTLQYEVSIKSFLLRYGAYYAYSASINKVRNTYTFTIGNTNHACITT